MAQAVAAKIRRYVRFPCRCTFSSKFGKIAAFSLYPGIGLAAGAAGIHLCADLVFQSNELSRGGVVLVCVGILLAFSVAAFCFWLSVICGGFECRKCMVDAQGITVIGPGRSQTFYKWDALYGVGIAAYGASASRQRYQKVLCCFLTPPGPGTLRRICDSYVWGAGHTKDVLILDLESSAAAEIRARYPGKIVDHRKAQLEGGKEHL